MRMGNAFSSLAWILAAAAAPAVAAGTLRVETNPPGATLLVDGKAWGTTPVAGRAVAPGPHRIRVVKEGYLDNSRLVNVARDQDSRVQVSLTPAQQGSGS